MKTKTPKVKVKVAPSSSPSQPQAQIMNFLQNNSGFFNALLVNFATEFCAGLRSQLI